MASPKSFKLNIFELFEKIKKSDLEYWTSLTEEQKKGFEPIVLIRWLSSNSAMELIYLNHFINPYITKFKDNVKHFDDHKELMYNLMTICSSDDRRRYKYVKKSSNIQSPKCVLALSEYLNYSIKESKEVLSMYDNEEIIEICNELGYQKDTILNIKKELKKRNV